MSVTSGLIPRFTPPRLGFQFFSFGEQVLSNGLGGLVGALLIGLLGKKKPKNTILHVEFRIVRAKGDRKIFKASGRVDDVLKAIETFERELQDD